MTDEITMLKIRFKNCEFWAANYIIISLGNILTNN